MMEVDHIRRIKIQTATRPRILNLTHGNLKGMIWVVKDGGFVMMLPLTWARYAHTHIHAAALGRACTHLEALWNAHAFASTTLEPLPTYSPR
jgi:hypothetical protein